MVATSRDTILPAITDQDIYLAFSNVFTGPDAEIRKTKRVKQLVRKAEQQPQVADLLRECEKRHISRKSLCKRIGVLLSAHVFESFAFAKLRFPDLPQSALQAPQAAEGEAPEAEASSSQPLNQAGATGVVPQWSDASDDLDDSGEWHRKRIPRVCGQALIQSNTLRRNLCSSENTSSCPRAEHHPPQDLSA